MKRALTLPNRMVFLAIALAWMPGAWSADDVEQAINEALEAYRQKNFSEAASNLDYAAQLVRQLKGGTLEQYLPEPLEGWTAEQSSSQAASTAFFGGGVSAEKTYRKDSKNVEISLVTDSPMLQGALMLITNPMFATSDGGKITKINGQKAVIKYQPDRGRGEITMVVNSTLITIKGRAEQQELLEYAKRIDVAGLSAQQ